MKDDSVRDKAMDELVRAKLRAGLKPGGASCPDAELLSAYVEHSLAPRERASCEAHLVSCVACQALVAELVRLSENDEPAGIQTAAGRVARDATSPRFRWAWAGSALAAILVGGLWYTGEFRNVLQQTPEIQRPIQNNSSRQPEAHGAAPAEEKGSAPAASAQREAQNNRPSENKTSNEEVRTGALAANIAAPQLQNRVIHAPAAAPPAARDRFSTVPSGAIAMPSERADLAKVGPGESGGASIRVGAGVAGGRTGRIPSGALSNSTSESAEKSKGAASPAPSSAPAQLSRATPRAMDGTADSMKPSTREAQAKDEPALMQSTTSSLHDKERAKKEAAASSLVNAATETMEVQAEPATSRWRVGRRGLIQQSDSKGRWERRKSGVKTGLNDIAFSSPNVGWAVGQAGTILRTTDGGTTWRKVPSPTAEDLERVRAKSDHTATIVTRGGQTFTTIDEGETWSDQ